MQHRSREVRQDLVMLRARDALVAVRTELINTTRGLVKSMGTRLPKFQLELRTQGRGGSSRGDARSAAALGASGRNPEC
jgi:hypothetical protein